MSPLCLLTKCILSLSIAYTAIGVTIRHSEGNSGRALARPIQLVDEPQVLEIVTRTQAIPGRKTTTSTATIRSSLEPKPVSPTPAPSSSGQSSQLSPGSSDDKTAALNLHNQARRSATQSSGHARPDLVWDTKLEADALAYAQQLAAKDQGLTHSGYPNEGENLYYRSPTGTITNAAQAWVNEVTAYHGEKIPNGNFQGYGHYTQVIWPTTTNVGMAIVKSASQKWYVVARYSPPGNWVGKNALTGS